MHFCSAVVVANEQGNDDCRRVRLRPDAICDADKRLGEILRYWNNLRAGHRLPSRSQIDVSMLKSMLGWIHVVDTSAASPGEYYYRLWGSSITLDRGKDHTKMTLGACPWPILRDAAMEDYGDVVATGEPAYHLISHTLGLRRHSFARLLLPLAADGRRVNQLLVLINERRLPCLDRETAALAH
jgi:hypothetical protein